MVVTQERPIRARRRPVRIATRRFRAFVFDMDGVITDTATPHFRAWKATFDEFLAGSGDRRGFTTTEYRRYVDGRPRLDGVKALLASRGVRLPDGSDADPPGRGTAWGLANLKNQRFGEEIDKNGVTAFPGSVALVRDLRAAGIRTAVVTASRNAGRILHAAGVADLFDVRIDGEEARRLHLAGKPDPATFLAAVDRLGTDPADAVVVEDALSGVLAGSRGGFGLVVGVARADGVGALVRHGADVVVSDLSDVTLLYPDPDCELCSQPSAPGWLLSYQDGEPAAEGTREALLTLGNGYMATRGAVPEARADSHRYPGTYVAGVYNRLWSTVEGASRQDESLVNLPNWLPTVVRTQDGRALDPAVTPAEHHHFVLDLRSGVLRREVLFVDDEGRRTRLRQRRLVSMAAPHLAALRTTVVAENWSGGATVRSTLDARVNNTNVAAFRGLSHHHLTGVSTGVGPPYQPAPDGATPDGRPAAGHRDAPAFRDAAANGDFCWLTAVTSQSRWRVALAGRLRVAEGTRVAKPGQPVVEHGVVGHEVAVRVGPGEPASVEKIVAIFTSRDRAISEPLDAAYQEVADAAGFDELCAAHEAIWDRLWATCHIELDAGSHLRLAVNLDVFHVIQTLSPYTADLDVGVPARGLHGEGYRGHVFWDELFVFPFYNFKLPELTRALLSYRYRRLPAARRLAASIGRRGALFPWQSGSDGREETPGSLFNPFSHRWVPDRSRRQYHVGLAVAYNIWHYWQVTGDLNFMRAYGVEMLVDIARFWADLATWDPNDQRYHIRGVMGPDEFHDGYPESPGGGVDNSAYVNVMTAWMLARACDAYRMIGAHHGRELLHRLGLTSTEVDSWEHITSRLKVPVMSNGLIAQFDRYEELSELDWSRYRDEYGEIGRLDLILESEGDSTNSYRLSKQADVLMLLYLFDASELTGIMRRLGYDFDPATIPAIAEYYLARTSHGSTLSRVAHAWVLARTNRRASWRMLHDALDSDLEDEGGTTREGIHLGAIAGAVDILQRCYTGLDARNDALWLHPMLPDELGGLRLNVRYRNHWLRVEVDHESTRVSAQPGAVPPVTVHVHGQPYILEAGSTLTVPRPGLAEQRTPGGGSG